MAGTELTVEVPSRGKILRRWIDQRRMRRVVAKNIVAAGFAEQCLVQVAYAIGVADPVSVMVNDFGTGTVDPAKLSQAVSKVWNLTPRGTGGRFDMPQAPLPERLLICGHFGGREGVHLGACQQSRSSQGCGFKPVRGLENPT